ncbi:MAG: hypothetical protein AAGB35_04115 [Pseudomonadota bacterium]
MLDLAQANNSARLEQIKLYIKCEALMNTMAEALSDSEEEYKQHPLAQEANNSRIIVFEFIRSGEFNEDGLGDLYVDYKSDFESLLMRNENDSQRTKFLDSLDKEIENCYALNELQEDIIVRNKEK